MRAWPFVVVTGLAVLAFGITSAQADEFFKIARMSCDTENSRALIRFVMAYRPYEVSDVVVLPSNFEEEYGYLDALPAEEICTFADGRELTLAYGDGEAHPYGQCGGDAGAHFSLSVGDKRVYYQRFWNGGRCSGRTSPAAVIVAGERLIECDDEASDAVPFSRNYPVAVSNCADASARLRDGLPHREQAAFECHAAVTGYEGHLFDPIACHHFASRDRRGDVLRAKFKDVGLRASTIRYRIENIGRVKSTEIFHGDSLVSVFEISNSSRNFEGSFFLYFFSPDEAAAFAGCAVKDECPQPIAEAVTARDVEAFIRAVERAWPSANVIDAEASGLSFQMCSGEHFNSISHYGEMVFYRNDPYFIWEPAREGVVPGTVVLKVEENGAVRTMCTFGRRRQDIAAP